MKCESCHGREATVHLTEVINDHVTKLHLCEECAKSKSEEMQAHFGLTDLITGLMETGPSLAPEDMRKSKTKKCGFCGMTYYDFQKTGKLGCGECYESFGKDLISLLKRIHGSDKHIGKAPFVSEKRTEEHKNVQRLKEELEELIFKEEFEKAVILRDRIKEMEEGLNSKKEVKQ
ncbi:UvrB/UvrC protein [Candidatus Omnitrophus magneticus]|uniref:UvrB/UvrC protein n=1 Tax=Candidatus Omnitrophus magneticus TaxID=1609969 RepID=A0A0F0CRQ8_9BACT|nr:UvrB/UvrC protein [Candidatus Omnitrophus magneticus]